MPENAEGPALNPLRLLVACTCLAQAACRYQPRRNHLGGQVVGNQVQAGTAQLDDHNIAGAAMPGAPSDPTFKASAVADYNGDGKADVVLYNGTAMAVWFMDGANLKSGAFFSTAPGESDWHVVGP